MIIHYYNISLNIIIENNNNSSGFLCQTVQLVSSIGSQICQNATISSIQKFLYNPAILNIFFLKLYSIWPGFPNPWAMAYYRVLAYLDVGSTSGGQHACMCEQLNLHKWWAGTCTHVDTSQLVQVELHMHVCQPAALASWTVHVCEHASQPLTQPSSPVPTRRAAKVKNWGLLYYTISKSHNLAHTVFSLEE